MYTIKVNENYSYELAAAGSDIKRNDQLLEIDFRKLGEGLFHIIHERKSYTIEIVAKENDKLMRIKVNGNVYEVAVEDQYDSLLKSMGLIGAADKTALEIKAPMPGMVLSVNVTVGQQVKKGDALLVLEAMKMENMIKSTTDGIVKTLLIAKGDIVEKNQVLIGF